MWWAVGRQWGRGREGRIRRIRRSVLETSQRRFAGVQQRRGQRRGRRRRAAERRETGGRGVHVFPVAERVHGLGRPSVDRDLGPDAAVTAVPPRREVGRGEPAGARRQQLDREHGRGHREAAHDYSVRGVQVRVAQLPLLAAQVQRADDRLGQVLGLQVFHDAGLHVRQHAAGQPDKGDQR